MSPEKLNGLELFDSYHKIAITSSFLFVFFTIIIADLCSIKKQNHIIKLLLLFTILQEIGDYIGRYQFNGLSFEKDLPLHLCHYALYMGVFSIYKKNQFCFEFTFLIGVIAAFFAIITPDMNDFNNWTNYITFFIHHSLIVLFPFWNIFIDKMVLRKHSIFYSSAFMIIIMFPIGAICWITEGNYMYLRKAPNVNNPLLFGDWPYYIINCIAIGFVLMLITFLIFYSCKKLIYYLKIKP